MATIKIYSRISSTKVIERTKAVSLEHIENDFKRYAKTYRWAYGFYPTEYSLSIQVMEYPGVAIDQLRKWIDDLKK